MGSEAVYYVNRLTIKTLKRIAAEVRLGSKEEVITVDVHFNVEKTGEVHSDYEIRKFKQDLMIYEDDFSYAKMKELSNDFFQVYWGSVQIIIHFKDGKTD